MILTPEQQHLDDLWEQHLRDEFVTRDTEAPLRTMVAGAYVNHVPVITGGVGREELREFYSRRFIPKMPPDTEIVPISRTIGAEQLVDEIMRWSSTIAMARPPAGILPGRAPATQPAAASGRIPVVAREPAIMASCTRDGRHARQAL
ncbi:MAG: hypothetical protein ACREQL_09055 [Candidatus Binatia bacterium]